MTNIFNHHLHRSARLRLAHSVPGQHAPSPMRPEAGKRVEAPASAFPRALPRDAASGIPREPARQGADRTPRARRGLFHVLPLVPAGERSSPYTRSGTSRPHRRPPPAKQSLARAPNDPLRGVRQDKYALTRVRRASLQAVTAEKDARTRRADPRSARSPLQGRQTVQVAAWIKPALRRRARDASPARTA